MATKTHTAGSLSNSTGIQREFNFGLFDLEHSVKHARIRTNGHVFRSIGEGGGNFLLFLTYVNGRV